MTTAFSIILNMILAPGVGVVGFDTGGHREDVVAIGFIIACLRNMLGTGSLLAFPGSMIGAALAGLAYSRYKTLPAAMAGEIFGTGIIGGFVAWIMATLLLGSKAVAWFFIPPFLVSTIGGSVIACLLLKTGFFKQFSSKEGK